MKALLVAAPLPTKVSADVAIPFSPQPPDWHLKSRKVMPPHHTARWTPRNYYSIYIIFLPLPLYYKQH